MALLEVTDLPSALQSNELIDVLVAGANAKAARVAPCLILPSDTWAATTAYALADKVKLSGNEVLEVTTAGTSGASEPTAPDLGLTVTDGTVTWTRVAPTADTFAEAKLILIGAVKRWCEAGSGAFQQQTAGIFGLTTDTRQKTGFNLWPSEIEGLQQICSTAVTSAQAFSITPSGRTVHAPVCSLYFGANYCSCGADLTNFEFPLYEGGVLTGDDY